ncbi:MAG: tetratricopeptide (TPR) repeat protein [Vicingaceae bacterium]|jgi:tetratricopeptide (TPR) repeat protein
MTKPLIFTLLLFCFLTTAAQTEEQQKKFNKIDDLVGRNKIDKAEKKLITFLEINSSYGDAWDLLASIKFYRYQNEIQIPNLFENIVFSTTDEDGNQVENESNTKALTNLLSSINPHQRGYDTYLSSLKLGLAHSTTTYKNSMNLRHALRENYSDTTLGKEEEELFREAEVEFSTKNYNKAAILYQKALDIKPQYYKASLYLGDCYYMMGNYIDAIEKFEICIQRFPNFLEPRKYIVDSYLQERLNEDALKAAIESKLVYPDLILNLREFQAAGRLAKSNSIKWTERFVLPNKSFKEKFNIVQPLSTLPEFEISKHWKTYQDALAKINIYCDSNGIVVKHTSLTKNKYLEVYGWEEMLRSETHKDLETAKEMQKLGYLDCYAFLTCFHDDFYQQYQHFVKNNKKKVRRYYTEIVLKSNGY